MAQRYGAEFHREVVQLVLTSRLTRMQVTAELGVGFSTLSKWIQQDRDKDLMTVTHEKQEWEFSRLRKENRILLEESEILKKAVPSSKCHLI